MSSILSRLFGRKKKTQDKPILARKYIDGEDYRDWLILKDLDPMEAVRKYPDFDVAYVRAAYPTLKLEDHENANVGLLLEGLEKSIVKSRILAQLSNYYVWNGDAERALDYAVLSFLTLEGLPDQRYLQPLVLLQRLFITKGFLEEAEKLREIKPNYALGHKEQADVKKIVGTLASPSYDKKVDDARYSLRHLWK